MDLFQRAVFINPICYQNMLHSCRNHLFKSLSKQWAMQGTKKDFIMLFFLILIYQVSILSSYPENQVRKESDRWQALWAVFDSITYPLSGTGKPAPGLLNRCLLTLSDKKNPFDWNVSFKMTDSTSDLLIWSSYSHQHIINIKNLISSKQ